MRIQQQPLLDHVTRLRPLLLERVGLAESEVPVGTPRVDLDRAAYAAQRGGEVEHLDSSVGPALFEAGSGRYVFEATP